VYNQHPRLQNTHHGLNKTT